MGAFRLPRPGGPDAMEWVEGAVPPPPAPGEATVVHHAVGVNFIDVYHRAGLYPVPLPSGLGIEGAGVVAAVAPDVHTVRVGDRVAYAGGPPGAYATARNLPAHRLLHLPGSVGFRTAAAVMLQGLTAAMLLRRAYPVRPRDPVLIHAAAGGVGSITCQWAKALGATVIGTVGSEAKRPVAAAHGCDHVILYGEEDVVERVRGITGGEGVAVVYDGVGRDTFDRSLDCLRPMGMMVSFGNASGVVPPVDLRTLLRKGSLFLTRPSLFDYTARRADLEALAGELFGALGSGQVRVAEPLTYPLREAAQAHRDLEGRQTTGALVLLP